MPLSKTKIRILEAACQCFNRQGFASTTLRDIAAETGISIGNLAYHFANKTIILEFLYEKMMDELGQLWSRVKVFPSFANIARNIHAFHDFQKAYRFFYQDMLEIERASEKVAAANRAYIERQIANIRAIIDYSVGSGNMQAEPLPGMYDRLAHTAWMLTTFWFSQQQIRQNNQPQTPDQHIWSLVIPHLTTKGKESLSKTISEEGEIQTLSPESRTPIRDLLTPLTSQ
ncbi:MAG: TetR/AcrR family transcriptional regulator [Bacteroidota bacterium]